MSELHDTSGVTHCAHCQGTTARHTQWCVTQRHSILAPPTAPATTATGGTTGSAGRSEHALKGTIFEHTIRPDLPSNPKQAYGDKKVPIYRVPPALMIYAALGLNGGFNTPADGKYPDYNWRDKPVETVTYYAAILRHLFAWFDGEEDDPESGHPHLAHAAAGLSILIDALTAGYAIETRPPKGAAADILERNAKK